MYGRFIFGKNIEEIILINKTLPLKSNNLICLLANPIIKLFESLGNQLKELLDSPLPENCMTINIFNYNKREKTATTETM